MNLKIRIFLLVMITVILSTGVVGHTFYRSSENALIGRGFDQLKSIRKLKIDKIETYFKLVEHDIKNILTDCHSLLECQKRFYHSDLKEHFQLVKKIKAIDQVTYQNDPLDSDYFQILFPWKDEAGFLFRSRLEKIKTIMTERTGLGETGETYILTSDGIFVTPSRFYLKKNLKANSATFKAAKKGQDTIIDYDYRQVLVLSAIGDFKYKGLHWYAFFEIDYDEVIAPIQSQKWNILSVLGMGLFALVGASIFMAHALAESEKNKGILRKAAMIDGQEKERSRISKELHDGVAQELTALNFRINLSPLSDEMKKEISGDVKHCLEEVRDISHELMPSFLQSMDLRQSLDTLLEKNKKNSSIVWQLISPKILPSSLEKHKLAIFRIIQESISNVLKHSEATECTVLIDCDQNKVVLSVNDNGKGFSLHAVGEWHNGLQNMRDRAEMIGAKLDIESQVKEGTTIKLTLMDNNNDH